MAKESDRTRSDGPKVFLSYAHDDEVHASDVRELASFLMSRGVSVELDDWHVHRRDRYLWAVREIRAADFVIVVASPGYRSAADATSTPNTDRRMQAEAALLRDQLYRDHETEMSRVLPVVLPGRSPEDLPAFTYPYSAPHFVIDSITDSGLEDLLRMLTGQPRHVRPSIGPMPGLAAEQNKVPVQHDVEVTRAKIAAGKIEHIARRLRSRRPDRWTTLTDAAWAVTVVGLLLAPGFSWVGAMLVGGIGLAVLAVARRDPGRRGSAAWKIASLMVTPLLAGGGVALPGGWSPVQLETAGDPSSTTSHADAPRPPTTRESSAQSTGPNGAQTHDANGTARSGPKASREPSEAEFRQAEASNAPEAPGRTSTSDGPPQHGSLEILAVGHSFSPGIDRITMTISNTHPEPVLIKQIEIYMSDWGRGHGHDDGDQWYFSTSGQIDAGTPTTDGTILTHGLIKLAGSEFSEPLVGQGYVDEMTGSWRRLLTFTPQKFLEGTGTVSIVVDLPTTHLLQQVSAGQPPGPVIAHKFDPGAGSIFTRVDVWTPHDSTFGCDYLGRLSDQPVCDHVDTHASVALPR